jgi:hypothetical protein
VVVRTFLEDVATMAPRSPRGCESSKKKANVFLTTIFDFFFIVNKFKRDDVTQAGLWRI